MIKNKKEQLKKFIGSLSSKINMITKNAPIFKGKDNMIELNPKNSLHKEWFEDNGKN